MTKKNCVNLGMVAELLAVENDRIFYCHASVKKNEPSMRAFVDRGSKFR